MTKEVVPYSDGNICANVTKSRHYIFKHNATQGITKVLLHFTFTNVTLGEAVSLRTKVSFEWYV